MIASHRCVGRYAALRILKSRPLHGIAGGFHHVVDGVLSCSCTTGCLMEIVLGRCSRSNPVHGLRCVPVCRMHIAKHAKGIGRPTLHRDSVATTL
jgi:hypothetical protein